MAYQIKAYGKLVYADILKIQNSGKKPVKILHLASILYIPESHAVDRPLPGEFYDNKVVSELHFGAICHFGAGRFHSGAGRDFHFGKDILGNSLLFRTKFFLQIVIAPKCLLKPSKMSFNQIGILYDKRWGLLNEAVCSK